MCQSDDCIKNSCLKREKEAKIMAKTTSFGYTDTAPAGGATKTLTRPNLNYAANYSVTVNTDNKAVITNLTTPVDQPETIRWQATNIANIYDSSTIDPSVYATSKQGISLVAQVNSILRVTDSVDPTFQVDLPISVHMVVKLPKSQYITSANLEMAIARCVAAYYETDSTGTTRLDKLVRGSMLPSTI